LQKGWRRAAKAQAMELGECEQDAAAHTHPQSQSDGYFIIISTSEDRVENWEDVSWIAIWVLSFRGYQSELGVEV